MDDAQFTSIVRLARSGDQAAAGCLFTASYRTLRLFLDNAMDVVLRKSQLEPEDIIQDVFAAAWRQLGEGEFKCWAAFLGWLKTITTNRVIDLRRRMLTDKRNVNREITDGGGHSTSYVQLANRLAGALTSPSRGVARHEAVACLIAQLWRLPDDYRQVIQLRFLDGLSVVQVAAKMKRSEPAIHMLCHRALLKLRDLMGSSSRYFTRT